MLCANLIGLGVLAAITLATPVQAEEQAGMPAMTDEAMIASAMAAAPVRSGPAPPSSPWGGRKDAHPARGRQWLHLHARQPGHAGAGSLCMDAAAMAWAHALDQPRDTAQGQDWLHVHAQGGTDASNTDPYATQPTTSNNWLQTGPVTY